LFSSSLISLLRRKTRASEEEKNQSMIITIAFLTTTAYWLILPLQQTGFVGQKSMDDDLRTQPNDF
jgi:hypothetical protein